MNNDVFSEKNARKTDGENNGHSRHWKTILDGVEFRNVKTGRVMDPESDGFLKMIRIDQNKIKARILYAKDLGSTVMTVAEMVEKTGAIAGINASYFDENNAPLGYLKVKNHEINDYIATPIIYSGVFVIQNGKGAIIHRDKFHPASYSEALQAGPRLVAGGSRTAGIQNTIDYRQSARRSGIAIDKEGRIVLYVTSPSSAEMNWNELINVLTGPSQGGGIAPKDILNLDGGSSTQLYVKTKKTNIDEGFARVPVAIGFFEK